MFRLAFVFASTCLLSASVLADFTGKCVSVLDSGDTIIVERDSKPVTVKLSWVACPVKGQDFNLEAAKFTRDLALDKDVEVKDRGVDKDSKILGLVAVEGKDLSAELLKAGYAWYSPTVSTNANFAELESQAKEKGLGVWSKPSPVAPWDWQPENCLPKLDVAALGYKYAGRPITPRQFDILYAEAVKFLFADGYGNAYDLQSNLGVKEMPPSFEIGEMGAVRGSVVSIVEDGKLLLEISNSCFSIVAIGGVKTNGLRDGSHYECVGLCVGDYSYLPERGPRKTVPELLLLPPVNQDQFKEYLDSGKRVYVYRSFRILVDPGATASYARCERCYGRGQILNPDRNNIEPIACPNCGGRGNFVTQDARSAVYENELRRIDASELIK